MTDFNKKFGRWGEEEAEKFLKEAGYEIIEKNFQKRGGEIDLIALKGETVHFVEVKTRKSSSIVRFGLPQEAVTASKRKKIIRTALLYIGENGDERNISWQFDVISIVCPQKGVETEISLIENAFEAEDFPIL